MKLTDKLIQKVGADKILHYLVTAWITAQASLYGFAPMMIAFGVLFVAGFVKEYWLDDTPDWGDWGASMLGGLTTVLCYVPYDMWME